jgi:hypothetical protein
MVRVMFGLTLGSPGLDAILGAAGALVLVPTEAAYRRSATASSPQARGGRER